MPKENKIASIVDSVYRELPSKYKDVSCLRGHAILTPTNELVDEINNHIVSLLPEEGKQYIGCDKIIKALVSHESLHLLYPIEFLNSINGNNFPTHELVLKKGVPIMLLHNLNQGLCNGTRLIVTALGNMIVQAEILTGTHAGNSVIIHRISLILENFK